MRVNKGSDHIRTQVVQIDPDQPQDLTFHQFLSTDGTTNGIIGATGDYSSTGITEFFIAPTTGETLVISRLIVGIRATPSARWERYGSIPDGISNGIIIQKTNGIVIDNITDNLPIKSNADWGSHCYDTEIRSQGAGDDFVVVRWSFYKSGQYIVLNGDRQEKFKVILNDDFTSLTSHTFKVEGYIRGTLQ